MKKKIQKFLINWPITGSVLCIVMIPILIVIVVSLVCLEAIQCLRQMVIDSLK